MLYPLARLRPTLCAQLTCQTLSKTVHTIYTVYIVSSYTVYTLYRCRSEFASVDLTVIIQPAMPIVFGIALLPRRHILCQSFCRSHLRHVLLTSHFTMLMIQRVDTCLTVVAQVATHMSVECKLSPYN